MKMFKSLAVLMISSIALFACSEGSYVPATTTTQGVAALQPGQAGYVAPGTNPYLTNGVNGTNGTGLVNGTNGANGQTSGTNNIQNQIAAQFGAAALNSCAARATPNFYLYTLQNSNLSVRRQPTYTPENCACFKAPCDCQQVLDQTRNQFNSPASSLTTAASINDYNTSNTINPDSKTMFLTITHADAKALYNRLAKAPVEEKNATHTQVRSGLYYKCLMDGNGKDDKDYACDFDISEADGVIYEIFPIGQDGSASIMGAIGYNGPNLTVGGTGLNAGEALIKIQGSPAKVLYGKIQNSAIGGSNPTAPANEAQIKLGKNVMCFESDNNGTKTYGCQVKVNTATGEAENASN